MASSDPRVVKLIGKATTGVANLAVAGSATAAALALQSWPILALGGVAYAALVAWDLASSEFRKSALGPTPDSTPTLGDANDYRDEAARAAVITIQAAKRKIAQVLDQTPDDVKANLAMALTSVDELERRAATMARRADDIARYLETPDPRAVAYDVQVLAERAKATADAEARAQYETALSARKEHLATLTDLITAKERIGASLMSIAATLEGLPPKIVKMRALDARAMDQLTGDVKEELDRMSSEIRSFEETLEAIGQVGVGT